MSDEFDVGDKVRRFQSQLDAPEESLEAVGLIMVAGSQAAFKSQRFGKADWKQRGKRNTFGIIADFAGGAKSPKKRRFDRRPALMDKGFGGGLVSTISHRVMGKIVEVGANKPYADVHQVGGKSKSEIVTKNVQSLLFKWLKSKGGSDHQSLAWILNKKFTGKRLETDVPARPYIGLTILMVEDIKEAVGVNVMEVE